MLALIRLLIRDDPVTVCVEEAEPLPLDAEDVPAWALACAMAASALELYRLSSSLASEFELVGDPPPSSSLVGLKLPAASGPCSTLNTSGAKLPPDSSDETSAALVEAEPLALDVAAEEVDCEEDCVLVAGAGSSRELI